MKEKDIIKSIFTYYVERGMSWIVVLRTMLSCKVKLLVPLAN